jgi:large subunit ribosomal protein L6
MSKIGRKPIDVGPAKIEIKGNEIHFSGKKGTGVYVLPEGMTASLEGTMLSLGVDKNSKSSDTNRIWGLHRALLANKIKGCQQEFEKIVQINGLGFKAVVSGSKVVFSLGFSHKIDFMLPKDVTLEVDKTGQRLVFRSPDKELMGQVCSQVRALRPPEPYKGTGVKYETEVIARKAGKTKAA